MSTTGKVSAGTPTRLRSFDPVRIADLEYQAWVGYYLRRWPRVLIASVGLIVVGPTVWVKVLGHPAPIFPAEYPALVSAPLAFLACWLVSLATQPRAVEATA